MTSVTCPFVAGQPNIQGCGITGGFNVGRVPAFWVTSVLALLVWAYAGKLYYPSGQRVQAATQAANLARMAREKSESIATQVSAATPENSGDALVGPLAVWMREANGEEARTAPAGAPQPMDHVFAPPQTPEKYLRATFALRNAAQFTFVIPPHTVNPRLHGSFQSFLEHSGTRRPNETGIDLVLMNTQQFDDFAHHRLAEATYELESPNHTVDFALPPTHDQPQEYHLVFRDHAVRANLFVKADFAVNAE
jgi:hypothetical protein